MSKLKTHGVTADTPNNLLMGAGAFYIGLKYEAGKWEGEVLGATSGGGKISIVPEYYTPDIDGAAVKVKGMTFKAGETATMEVKMAEFSRDTLINSLHLEESTDATVSGYKKYISKRTLADGDYLENIGWVGTLTDGRQAIIIFPNALITSAMEIEAKNKETSTFSVVAECTATFEQDDLEHLPYEIYFPDDLVGSEPQDETPDELEEI